MSTTRPSALLRHIRQLAGVPAADPLSDRELLRRFTMDRDEAAFAMLVRRHGPMVLSVCRRRLHRAQDIEDAFQATFLVLLRKAAMHPWREGIGGWLHGVASRVALRVRAEAMRSSAAVGRTSEEIHADPLEQLTARELFAALDEELARLAAAYREPLVLCSLQGQSQEEAARQLGWSLSTVRRRLERGRKLLHTRMAQRGLSLPAALTVALLSRHEATAILPVPVRPDAFSARATLLADAVWQAAVRTSLKATASLLVMLGVVAAGAGWAARHTLRTEPPQMVAATGPEAPKSDKAERTDRYGDPLPPGAIARLGTIHLRHANGTDMMFSKDGKRLISCDIGGEVRVWDVATGRLIRRRRLAWKPHEHNGQNPWQISLAPDGATAVAWEGGEKTTYLYDMATGRERGRLPNAEVLAFSPDGKKIAVQGRDKEGNGPAHLWDVVAFKKHINLDVPPGIVLNTATFTPDGKRLAASSGKSQELFVWDAVTGQVRQRKKFHTRMMSLAYAPDGAILAAGFEGRNEVVLFDAATLKEKAALPSRAYSKGAGYWIWQLGFSLDGRLLAERRFFGGEHPQENGLLIWDLSEPAKPRPLPTPTHVQAFALAPDGKTLAYCYHNSNAIALWDMASGRRLHQLPGHDVPVYKLAVSPDGKILASSDWKPGLLLWDTATGKPLCSLAGWDSFGSACLLFSADGRRLISVSRQGKLQVWEVATGKELCRFAINAPGSGVYPAYGVAFFGDSKRLAAVTGLLATELSLWDTATGEQLHRRSLSEVQPRTSEGIVELAPDGESAAVWRGDRLTIEDISTQSLLATLPKGVGNPLAFSADGRLLAVFLQPRETHSFLWMQPIEEVPATYDVKGLSLVETASGQEIVRLDIRKFDHVAFTPDGRALVVTDKQKLTIWDTATGEQLHQMKWPESVRDGHGYAKISSLAVLPGGRATTGMTEGDILIWDLAAPTWPAYKPTGDLSRQKLDALWSDLAGDAPKAHRAVRTLTETPAQTVPFLGDHLQPVRLDGKRMERLLADLDGNEFAAREAAERELTELGDRAEPRLRQALEDKPSLEMRRRLQAILAGPKRPSAESLRTLRAIAVLERIGTPEARHILEKLSAGAASRETREAKAALQRLNRR